MFFSMPYTPRAFQLFTPSAFLKDTELYWVLGGGADNSKKDRGNNFYLLCIQNCTLKT